MAIMDRSDWRRVPVWDAPTRLFHWLVVVLIAACYVTFRLNWMDWHIWAGEAVLALLLFRLLWGLFGSDTARFSRFLASPAAACRHLAHLHRREPDTGVGHNPAGGWMVIVMIAILLGQTLTGLYENNDIADEGPFTELVPARVADLISDLHKILWNVLLAAIALHLVAIVTYAVVKRQNLLHPMVTGRKRLPEEIPAPRIAPWARAVVLLGVSVGITVMMADWL
jgi:cytochrome b